jgi:hypothetical protein
VTLTKLGPKLTARCLLPAPSYSVRVVHTNGHVRVGESGTCRALPLLDSSPIHPEARESMRWQGTDATGPPFPLNSTCARARRPISTTRTRHSSNDREESTCACARSQATSSGMASFEKSKGMYARSVPACVIFTRRCSTEPLFVRQRFVPVAVM